MKSHSPIVVTALSVVVAFVATACAIVHGRVRPVWNASWSELSCTEANAADQDVLMVLVKDEAGKTLPGVTITATPDSHEVGGSRQSVTDRYGEVQMKLAPSTWSIEVELIGFERTQRRLSVPGGYRCHLLVYLHLEPTIITAQRARPNSA